MARQTHVVAGECTTRFEGDRDRTRRGHVVCVVKPDGSVLVHDATGYQPVAWLTRPETTTVESDPTRITAGDDDQRLYVEVHREHARVRVPASAAGAPLRDCPDCPGTLVRAGPSVACLDCGREHSIPADATVLDARCPCGLPRMRTERGAAFEVCVDRGCESLDAAVRDRFDRTWACPTCGEDLRVLRRGGLVVGCDAYPDCETEFSFPRGTVVDDCGCGLPVFETARGRRCLYRHCEEGSAAAE